MFVTTGSPLVACSCSVNRIVDPNSTRVEPCPIPFSRVRGQGASWRPLKIPQELGTQTHNAVQPVTEVLVVTGTPPNEAVKTSGSGSMESLRPAWLSLTSRAGVAGPHANRLSVGLFVGCSLRMLVNVVSLSMPVSLMGGVRSSSSVFLHVATRGGLGGGSSTLPFLDHAQGDSTCRTLTEKRKAASLL